MVLQNFKELIEDERIFRPDQLKEIMSIVRKNFRFSQVNTKHKYFNVPAAFDLESTSFYDDSGSKVGLMYAWTFGLYGLTIIGRTWKEFEDLMQELSDILDLGEKKRLIVYIHNEQFDFQFIRSHLHWEHVFATDRRKPLYALTDSGIEFRCSYMLSGLSLDTVGKNLLKYTVKKMTGDLNYNLIRHQETALSRKELKYIQNDAKVVMAYIGEEIERVEGIANIPLTKTGYVRKYCRNACFYDPETGRKDKKKTLIYRNLIKILRLDPDLFRLVQHAFAGGFTHANCLYVDKIVDNVSSYDFTSCYPAVMVAERYPMGPAELIDCTTMTKEEFEKNIALYCCIFTIHLYNVQENPDIFDNYISESKCIKLENAEINNGRVVSADYIEIAITEVDYSIIKKVYTFDSFQVSNMYRSIRGYLPKDFVLAILDLYKAKTELKGVEGKEQEYMVSKGMLNATYGMACTSPIREINNYEDEIGWLDPEQPDMETALEKYNKKFSRFDFYCWSIYVTAYSRRNLFTAIVEAGEDYVYSDTDSIKLKNADQHKEYFENYNKSIIAKLEYALNQQGIPVDYIRPKTIKGVEKPLGVWDYEGTFRIKTLGAKRYMIEENGELSMTVSGINKHLALPYLKKKYKTNDKIFAAFKNGFYIPPGYSGKSTHTYIDDIRAGVITDYQGTKAAYEEKTGIHLEEAEYKLSLSGDFVNYLIAIAKGV